MNELRKAVSGLYAEPGFFAGEISPLRTRESTGDVTCSGGAGFLIDHSIGYIRIHSNNE